MRVELDIPLHLDEIVKAVNAKKYYKKRLNSIIRAITTDTRECEEGDLFIALKGQCDSGERYVSEALLKQCSVISAIEQSGAIYVDDTNDALLQIAKLYKSKLPLKSTVAITGSVGKSTTVKFVSKILTQKYKVHSPSGNFNNHLGVPLTVLGSKSDTEILVSEFGMNHIGEISKLSKCIEPDIGVITGIGTAHIGNLGSREGIATAKSEILDGIKNGSILIPYGEPLLQGLKKTLSVGRNTSLSDFALNNISSSYTFNSAIKSIDNLKFFDSREHLLVDLCFAIAVSVLLGLSESEIQNGVGSISENDLRQKFITLRDFTIFDDSYNASLESIRADLIYISKHHSLSSALLGDVLELGDNATMIHESIGRIAAGVKLNKLYLYGQHAHDVARGAISAGMEKSNIFINDSIPSPEISARHILDNHTQGEVILFKGSHNMHLNKIIDIIMQDERIRK